MPTRHLYELCSVCDGAGAIDPARIAGADRRRRPGADGKIECPSCGGTKYVKIGLTAGQVERIVAENDRLKAGIAATIAQIDLLQRADSMSRVREICAAMAGPYNINIGGKRL